MNRNFIKEDLKVKVIPDCETLLLEAACPAEIAGQAGRIVSGQILGKPEQVEDFFNIDYRGHYVWFIPIDLLEVIK